MTANLAPLPTALDERKFYAAIRVLPGYLVGKVIFDKATSCWQWATPQKEHDGIRVWNGERDVMAHRTFYEELMFPIKPGMVLIWLCENERCCNPEHLRPISRSAALKRSNAGRNVAIRQLAKTHCPQGHAYDEANTLRAYNRRACRACIKAKSAARYRRKKELDRCQTAKGDTV